MNVSAVSIDDDDVVIVIKDDTKSSKPNRNANTAEDTIILDEEPLTSNGQCDKPSLSNKSAVKNSAKDISFARLLKNNMLMNKIIKECFNMANNAGMSRVVNKTLLPIYDDLNNEFKTSQQLTRVLTLHLKKLKNDRNYKFLHLKSLCEHLKPWILKKRVPLVTLSKDLKGEKEKLSFQQSLGKNNKHIQKQCNSKKVNKETDCHMSSHKSTAGLKSLRRLATIVGPIQPTSNGCLPSPVLTEKAGVVINLDNSDDETAITIDDDEDISIFNGDSDDIMIVDNTTNSDVQSNQSNNENSLDVNENCKKTSAPSKYFVPKITSLLFNIDKCDLLVPRKAVTLDQHHFVNKQCLLIEEQIKVYQQKILELEETEVTDSLFSPYVECDRYKALIVKLYKKLCKITGKGDGNLLKQRVVRLQVAEGHPPGPVKRLEHFLNSTIDETGIVPLPDLQDVVGCVTESNIADELNWSPREIMKEAIGLFTQCCHALRKSRQKREYKDLMSLVQDRQGLDDYDPANEDPNLLAKLEENKMLAKMKEEEILDRYVKMENMPKRPQILTPILSNISTIKHSECTDTESDSDSDPTLSSKCEKNLVVDNKKSQETTVSTTETISNLDKSRLCNIEVNNEHPNSIENENFGNKICQENAIDALLNKPLTTMVKKSSIPPTHTQINTTNISMRNNTNITVQNHNKCSKLKSTNPTATNINQQNTTYSIPNRPITSQNIISTTMSNSSNKESQIQRRTTKTQHKIDNSNEYVLSYESQENIKENYLCSDVKQERRDDFEEEMPAVENTGISIKEENIKKEPTDTFSLFYAHGDNYTTKIFDIEDPFLVIEISDSSDDEL